jgi:hypothetical protein
VRLDRRRLRDLVGQDLARVMPGILKFLRLTDAVHPTALLNAVVAPDSRQAALRQMLATAYPDVLAIATRAGVTRKMSAISLRFCRPT